MTFSFDAIYMDLAKKISQQSHCVKKKVGAVLAKETRVISTGYNGPPSGTYNCDEKWPEVGCPRTIRGGCSLSLHAEQNAILYAMKNHVSLQNATLYVTLSPCLPCARIVFSVGIQKVVYLDSYAMYKEIDIEEGVLFLKSLGVHTLQFGNMVS